MFKPYSFLQNARKIVNLRFKLSRRTEESKLDKLKQHPAVRVMVMGLALTGLVSFGQYLAGNQGTKVQVITHQAEEQPAPPVLAKEPSFIPEGSPTAPEAVPVEASPAPVMTTGQEEQESTTGPDWANSQAPIRGQLTKGFNFGYAAFFDDYRLHSGLDYTAPRGTPVTAVLGGTVEAVYQHELFGPMIIIAHEEGWKSYYAPVEDVEVVLGQWVDTGSQLGRLGSPPPAEKDRGTHLHFELHHRGEPVDPSLYIK